MPPPSAAPRIIKHLPPEMRETSLYDIFRMYGALATVRTTVHGSLDTGIVEFWDEEDARRAEDAMHCSEIDGQMISVQIYQTNRRTPSGGVGTEFSIKAAPFVPSGSIFPYPASHYSPPRGPSSTFTSPRSISQPLPGSAFIHGPGQQVQLAPPIGPGAGSHSGLIDPCNLFCKVRRVDPKQNLHVPHLNRTSTHPLIQTSCSHTSARSDESSARESCATGTMASLAALALCRMKPQIRQQLHWLR